MSASGLSGPLVGVFCFFFGGGGWGGVRSYVGHQSWLPLNVWKNPHIHSMGEML